MGFSSTEEIVAVLILMSLLMVLLQVAAILFEGARAYQREVHAARWSCCNIHVPTFYWAPSRSYACFLSHYKIEAASDARYLHDMLSQMLQSPVYLDSSKLTDLRTLFTEGVNQSDCVLLLATSSVLTRPWCLLELLEAHRRGIPVLPVAVVGAELDVLGTRSYIDALEAELGFSDPKALELLRKHCGAVELCELKGVVHAVLEVLEKESMELTWNPYASDLAMRANLQDIVERMAGLTGRHVKWDNRHASTTEPNPDNTNLWSTCWLPLVRCFGRQLDFLIPDSEARSRPPLVYMTYVRRDCHSDAKVLQAELSHLMGRPVGGTMLHEEVHSSGALGPLSRMQSSFLRPIKRFASADKNGARPGLAEASLDSVANSAEAGGISAGITLGLSAKTDGTQRSRAARPSQAAAVAQRRDAATCARCHTVVVLLTRGLLHQPDCLVDIFDAIRTGKRLVTVCLERGGCAASHAS